MQSHQNISKKYISVKDIVDKNQRDFEPNPDFMDSLEDHLADELSQDNSANEEFEEEETTTAEEMVDFMNKQGKVYDGGNIRLQEKTELSNRINSLNREQRKIFDELMDRDSENQMFLYLYGKAGTGKTYLLNTIIPALEFKALKSGMDLNKPLVMVMSPTAAAAKHLLYGDTIHGSLKFNGFENAEKQMRFSAEASLASDLSQVQYVIIDEISMVDSNFLWDINKKLQCIMGNHDYFGGLNIIATGDFHQLQPVIGPWVFNTTSIRGRCNATATNIWKCYFKMYLLQQNVRSGSDEIYAWLQENIAVGNITDDMLQYIEARVVECPTLFDNDWYKEGKQVMITPHHKNKDRFNATLLQHCDGEECFFQADDKLSAKSTTTPDMSKLNEMQTKGLPTNQEIRKNCPVKITKNINKSDLLVNGTFGYVYDFDEANHIVWCIFEGATGQKTRNNSKLKHPLHKTAVPITRTSEVISLKQAGKSYTFKRTQFPLVLAYAITCHSSQGLTKERVIIDFPSAQKRHASFFVAFSRATSLEGFFLLNPFKKESIFCDQHVLNEYERLKTSAEYKFLNTYLDDPCFFYGSSGVPCHEEVKMAYLNINGLLHSNHFNCLKQDVNLLASHILVIAESKLPADSSNEDIELDNFVIVLKLQGMVLYRKQSLPEFNVDTLEMPLYPIVACHLPFGTICFAYVHPKITAAFRKEFIQTLKSVPGFVAVIGDLNIRRERGMKTNHTLTDVCEELSAVSAFSQVTHLLGAQLDYVLLRQNAVPSYLAGCFKNMYSDHHSVFLRVGLGENIATASNSTSIDHPVVEKEHPIAMNISNSLENTDLTSPARNKNSETCQKHHSLFEEDVSLVSERDRSAQIIPSTAKKPRTCSTKKTARNLCRTEKSISTSNKTSQISLYKIAQQVTASHKSAIEFAGRHGIRLLPGSKVYPDGNCAFNSAICNINERQAFSDVLNMGQLYYRQSWVSKL